MLERRSHVTPVPADFRSTQFFLDLLLRSLSKYAPKRWVGRNPTGSIFKQRSETPLAQQYRRCAAKDTGACRAYERTRPVRPQDIMQSRKKGKRVRSANAVPEAVDACYVQISKQISGVARSDRQPLVAAATGQNRTATRSPGSFREIKIGRKPHVLKWHRQTSAETQGRVD